MTPDRASVAERLMAAGLLPAAGCESHDLHEHQDLLPSLAAIWTQLADGSEDQHPIQHARRMARWCHAERERGARLTAAPPDMPPAIAERWFGPRLAFWPTGIPSAKRVGLASSRLGRRLESRSAWFMKLRAVCATVDPHRELLLTSLATTTDRFLERAAELFGVRLLRVRLSDKLSATQWGRRIVKHEAAGSHLVDEVLVSPPLIPTSGNQRASQVPGVPLSVPSSDTAIVALSDRLLVLHVRPNGHWQRLLEARLADRNWPTGSVFVAVEEDLRQRELTQRLMDCGAVGWVLLDPEAGPQPTRTLAHSDPSWNSSSEGRAGEYPLAPIVQTLPGIDDGDFLTHATRRRNGPWPDQTEREFLADLILARDQVDRTPLSALERILSQQCLRASSDTIRGGQAVVSFTAIPLVELPRHRVYRAHRGGWDFEPYGLCIRRSWLVERGTRAVHYGDEADWATLPDQDRSFFQLHRTRGPNVIDWSTEQEWRCPHDVDLRSLPHDAAFVFVPTRAEAERIATISRWPVLVLSAG